ncbi:MAG: hypothetical protein NTW86_25230 [Candidatus Sumerlaeota bacterium]|nr:hypothetical protein [Candidatus Sumerlaeota bacterium]
MDPSAELRSLLNRLGGEIERWKPARGQETGQPEGRLSFPQKVRLLADKLEINEKTLNTWLSKPDPAMSLAKFLELCRELDVLAYTLIPGAPLLQSYSEFDNPIRAEEELLTLEKAMSPGARVAVLCPLWPTPLQLDPLLAIYADKSHYRRYSATPDDRKAFSTTDRLNQTLELRRQRRAQFASGHYRLELVFMRDELERWINGDRLFGGHAIADRIKQLDYVVQLLETAGKQASRLQLRLSSAYFRSQYALYQEPGGSNIAILATNGGYIRLQDAETQAHLSREFGALWGDQSIEELKTSEEWVRFLTLLKEELGAREKKAPRKSGRIDLKSILEAPKPEPVSRHGAKASR